MSTVREKKVEVRCSCLEFRMLLSKYRKNFTPDQDLNSALQNISALLYQLSYQANYKLIII